MENIKNSFGFLGCLVALDVVLLSIEWTRIVGAVLLLVVILALWIGFQVLKSMMYRKQPKNRGLKGYIEDIQLYYSVAKALEEGLSTTESKPRFKLQHDKDVTKIYMANSALYDRALKGFESALEAGLPTHYRISGFDQDKDRKEYQITIFDSRKYVGEFFDDEDKYLVYLWETPEGGYQFKLGGYELDMRDTPHMLIGGASGSGKTNLLYLLLLQAIKGKAEVHVVDMKLEMSGISESVPFYHDYDSVMALLDNLLEIIRERMSYMAVKKIGDCSKEYSAVYLFFDELSAFSLACPSPKEQKAFQRKISEIILQGRKAGVFAIISGQYHTNETSLPVASRESLAVKIALGRANRTALDGMGMNVEEFEMQNEKFKKGEGYIFGLPGQTRPSLIRLEYLAFDIPEAIEFIKKGL